MPNLEQQLTPQEKERYETLKKGKENIFVFDDSFDSRPYLSLKRQLERLERFPQSPQRKAEKFLDIWEDMLTAPERANVLRFPAFAAAELFERSFRFLKEPITEELKERIARLQVDEVAYNANQELGNVYKGMWAYYLSPDYKLGEDGERIRGELRRALVKVAAKEPGIRAKLERLSLFVSSGGELTQFPKGDEIQYFAKLYAEDERPLAPELRGVLVHDIEKRGRGGAGGFETGIPMPPHVRLYTFENNCLPTPRTLDQERVEFYMSNDPLVLGEERDLEIVADRLPRPILLHWINRLTPVRLSAEYRGAQQDKRWELRKRAVDEFTRDLFNFDSELWRKLSEELDGIAVLAIQEKLARYKSEGRPLYLAFAIGFHLEKLGEEGSRLAVRKRRKKHGARGGQDSNRN